MAEQASTTASSLALASAPPCRTRMRDWTTRKLPASRPTSSLSASRSDTGVLFSLRKLSRRPQRRVCHRRTSVAMTMPAPGWEVKKGGCGRRPAAGGRLAPVVVRPRPIWQLITTWPCRGTRRTACVMRSTSSHFGACSSVMGTRS